MREQPLGAERIITEIPHTRTAGRQNHENVLPNISSRVVAATVAELSDFIVENPAKSWPAALERAERKTLRILQETTKEGVDNGQT